MFIDSHFNWPGCLASIVFTYMIVSSYDFTFVADILDGTFARNRTVGLPGSLAVARWWWWCNILLQNSSIFSGDLTCHIWYCSIGCFNCVNINNFGKRVIFWEILYYLNKLCYDVGFDIFAVWRDKIYAFPCPSSIFSAFIDVIGLINLSL